MRLTLTNAKKYTLRLLSQRPYSKQEIRNKLSSHGFPEEIINEVIEEFSKKNWINDYAFAKSFVESRIRNSPRGVKIIENELKEKGIPAHIIEEVLLPIKNTQAQIELAISALNKKRNFANEKNISVRKQKAYRYLLQRGFDSEVIESALQQIGLAADITDEFYS